MAKYTENDLQNALEDIRKGMSAAQAARVWSVPRTTLCGRIRGAEPYKDAKAHCQRLSVSQEQSLTEWIRIQGTIGYPPTHATIRFIASRILANDGDPQPLGRNWMEGFLRRNPSVKTMKGKSIESARLANANAKTIQDFFQRLKEPALAAIPAQHRYNMDESGIMEGLGVNVLVVGASDLRQAYMKEPNKGKWMTFVECISAQGHALNPLVILNGKSIQQQWFPESLINETRGWHFAHSERGWTSNDYALEWLRRIFIPETKPQDPQQRRLLILDGHGSHATEDFMWECFNCHIQLLYLPAHTSHILQPLDLAIFGPLKSAYRKHAGRLYMQTDTSGFGKSGFLLCFAKARNEGITSQNIKAGWRAAGLWPLNPRKPLRNGQLLPQHSPQRLPQQTQQQQANQPFYTPQRRDDIRSLMQRLHDSPRKAAIRVASRKLVKAHDQLTLKSAMRDEEVQSLKAQIELLQPRKRARVKPNPNEKFVNIVQIMKAKQEAKDKEAVEQRRAEAWQQNHSPDRAMHQYSFEELCFQWQLET